MSNNTAIAEEMRALAKRLSKRIKDAKSGAEQDVATELVSMVYMMARYIVMVDHTEAASLIRDLEDPERTYLIERLADRGIHI